MTVFTNKAKMAQVLKISQKMVEDVILTETQKVENARLAKEKRAEYVVGDLRRVLLKSKDMVAKFAASLASDPIYAFQWGDDAVMAAARVWLYDGLVKQVDSAIAEGSTFSEAVTKMKETVVVRLASDMPTSIGGSTSAMRNVSDQAKIAVMVAVTRSLYW